MLFPAAKGVPNTERGFILINPDEASDNGDGGGGVDGGSENGKMPKLCSLAKCIWIYKKIVSVVYVLTTALVYALVYLVAVRFIPNIILTCKFATASLKVINGVHLSPHFYPMRKINKNEKK